MIFGGVSEVVTNTRTNQIQSCYIQVPTLRQISWEAVNKHVDLKNQNPENLKAEGIPPDLICQLMA